MKIVKYDAYKKMFKASDTKSDNALNIKNNNERRRPIVNEDMYDYIANILASALLARNNEAENQILRDENEKVVKRIIKS